jgi:hypothetical protein
MFQVTLIGTIVLTLLCLAAVTRPLLFLCLLPTIALMQTFALLTVSSGSSNIGVGLFVAVVLVSFTQLLLLCCSHAGRKTLLKVANADTSLAAWFAYTAVSVAATAILPIVFAGVEVTAMHGHSAGAPPTGLTHNLNHLAQALNVMGMFVIVLHVRILSLACGQRQAALALATGFIVAIAASVLCGGYQRAVYLGFATVDWSLWATNPSVIQSFDSAYGAFKGIRRGALPFIEPSYAGAWFAATATGSFALFCFGRIWWKSFGVVFALCTVALLNTLSSTGIIAFGSWMAGFSLLTHTLVLFRLAHVGKYKLPASLARAALIQAVTVFVVTASAYCFPDIRDALYQAVSKLAQITAAPPPDTATRGTLNTQAIAAFVASKGLGLGTGSVKASGFFHGLLANVGVAGTLLFIAALAVQSKRAFHLLTHTGGLRDVSIAYLAGMSCLLISLAGGISDQNWPVLWIMIFLGYAISLCDGVDTDVPIPTRRDSHEPASTLNPSAPPADSAAAPPAAAASAQRPPTVTSQSTPHKPAPK